MIQQQRITELPSCRPVIRAVLRPTLWADMVAQARHYDRAVRRHGHDGAGQACAWAMLFNLDAALSKNTSTALAAAIARDEDGRLMGASALVLQGIVDPEVIGSIACRMALPSSLRADNFRLASECLNVVKSIQ